MTVNLHYIQLNYDVCGIFKFSSKVYMEVLERNRTTA